MDIHHSSRLALNSMKGQKLFSIDFHRTEGFTVG